MNVKIYPSKCQGKITIPPSKSLAHRSIICASLASGTSIINNISYSEDILATIDGMVNLGANIVKNENQLIITGIKNFNSLKNNFIECRESASTLRFFIPIFSLTEKKITFTGKNKLLKRPQTVYNSIFKSQNLHYFQNDKFIEIKGKLNFGEYIINGDISSQFISGLLFTLPLLNGDSIVKIIPPFESKPYVELTLETLCLFGIKIEKIDDLTFFIKGNQFYKPCNYTVEGDFSQFAFFAVLGALNNSIECYGLSQQSKQGDKQIVEILRASKINIENRNNGYFINSGTPIYSEVDLANCPDIAPILTVFGAFANRGFKINNIKRLRYKESNRIFAMENELNKLGFKVTSDENSIFINTRIHKFNCDEVFGHKDHRIIMSLAILATVLDKPLTIIGAEFVQKSYPNFFEDLEKLGIKLERLP